MVINYKRGGNWLGFKVCLPLWERQRGCEGKLQKEIYEMVLYEDLVVLYFYHRVGIYEVRTSNGPPKINLCTFILLSCFLSEFMLFLLVFMMLS